MATILLIDDEPMLLELFREVLHGGPHRILIAASVREALDVLERERTDAVICDYRLGDGSGEDVLDWIRRRRPGLMARTALLSGADASDVRCKDVMLLGKPLPLERLLDVVGTWFPGGEGGG